MSENNLGDIREEERNEPIPPAGGTQNQYPVALQTRYDDLAKLGYHSRTPNKRNKISGKLSFNSGKGKLTEQDLRLRAESEFLFRFNYVDSHIDSTNQHIHEMHVFQEGTTKTLMDLFKFAHEYEGTLKRINELEKSFNCLNQYVRAIKNEMDSSITELNDITHQHTDQINELKRQLDENTGMSSQNDKDNKMRIDTLYEEIEKFKKTNDQANLFLEIKKQDKKINSAEKLYNELSEKIEKNERDIEFLDNTYQEELQNMNMEILKLSRPKKSFVNSEEFLDAWIKHYCKKDYQKKILVHEFDEI